MSYWLPEVGSHVDTTKIEEHILVLYSEVRDFVGLTIKKEPGIDLYNVYLNGELVVSRIRAVEVEDLFSSVGYLVSNEILKTAIDETDSEAAMKKYEEDRKKAEDRVFLERMRILGSID